MEILKRTLSAFLAMVLVLGMLPMPAAASELSIAEVSETSETAAAETLPAVVPAPVETEAPETLPQETEAPVTEPEQTVPAETEPQVTVPQETASETESEAEISADSVDGGESYSASMTQAQFDQLLAEAKRTGTLNLNEQVTLTKNVTIPENVQFNINGAGGIVVPSGKTLTICGRGNIYGTLQVQAGGTLAISGEIPTWIHNGATVDIQGTYTHGEYLGILYRFAENGQFRHTLTGVSDTDIGSYIQVRDDSNWADVLDIFRNPDYMYVTMGVQGSVTLPEDVTAGVNRAICVEGTAGSTLTIPEGVTLTTEGSITVYNDYNLVNNGNIILNTETGQSVQIMGHMTNNGTIETGRFCWFYVNGELTNNGRIVNGWDIYVQGKLVNNGNIDLIDTESLDYYALLQVEENGQVDNHGSVDCYGAGAVNVVGTWNGNDPVYHSLPQPVNLAWHKMARQGSVQTAKGHIYWQAVNPQDNSNDHYVIHIYNADTNEEVYRDNCSFGGMQTNDRSLPSFIVADLPSGNYYFTVTATSNSDEYEDSAPARSDVFSYTRPASSIGGSQNLRWNGPNAAWDAPSKADSLTTYQVQWYYAPDADSEPQMRAGDTNVYGTQKNLQPWMVESCGAGYYSFKVQAIPGDGTRYTVGEWVESEQFYYDPATFAYDESYLEDLHSSRPPQMDESLDFKLLQDRVVLQNDLTLPENSYLDIINGGSITVPAGKTLTLNHYTGIYNGGKLTVEEGGKLIVNAYLWLGYNGTMEINGDIEFGNDCWIHVNFGQDFTLTGVSDDKVFKEYLFDPGLGRVEDLLNEFETSSYGWNVLRIEGDMTLPRSVTSPANSNIYIPENSSLTIPQNVTLSISQDAQMNVAGKLYNNGTIQGLNQGIGPEAVLYVPENGYVRNSGRVIANTGTVVDVAGTWEGNAPERNGGVVTMTMSFQNFKAQVDAAAKQSQGATVQLTNNVVVESNLTIPKNVWLAVNGGTLTVPAGKTLTLNGGAGLNDGGRLIVEAGGKLVLNEQIWVNWNGRLINQGTVTFGKNAVVNYAYGSENGAVTGIPHANMVLIMGVDNFEFPDWQNWKAIFENHDYANVQLEVWGYSKAVLDEDLTVPANSTLIINPSQNDLNNNTHNDWVTINGNVDVYGMMYINSRYNGRISVPCNLRIGETGSISVKEGGRLNICGNVENNGRVSAYSSSQVYDYQDDFGAEWAGNAPEYEIITQDYFDALLADAAQTGNLELDEQVTLTKNVSIPAEIQLNLLGGTIVVPSGKTLTINGWAGIWADGALIVEKGGKLVVNGDLWVLEYGALANSGTVTVNESGSITHYYGDSVSITGISEDKLTLHINSWREGALEAFQNNTYGKCYLQMGAETLTEDLNIPENGVLLVGYEEEGTFTIPEGVTVINNGEIRAWDNMTVVVDEGTVVNHGTMNIYGDLEVNSYSELNPDLGTVETRGCIHVYGILHTRGNVTQGMRGSGAFINNGNIWVYTGGHMQNDGTMATNPVLCGGTYSGQKTITQDEFEAYLENLEDPWIESMGGSVFLERNLTINKPFENFNSSIYVPRGVTLTINAPVLIHVGGDLIVEEGGKLVNNSTITSYAAIERGGCVDVDGIYTHGKNAVFKVLKGGFYGAYNNVQLRATSNVSGILNKYQTWYYQYADEEDFGNVMYYAQEGSWGVAGVEVESYNMVLNTDAVIPENAKLVMIQGYADLEHPCGNDWVVINSNLTVHGELEIRDQYLDEHRQLEINGNISLMKGAVMNVSGNVLNNGNVYAFDGSEVNYYEEHGYVWEGDAPVALENGQIGGTCGEGVQWTFTQKSGLLTISGEGYMEDFEIGDAPWAAFADSIKSVQVDKGVVHVGYNAFRGLPNLTKAVMADSVMNVAYAAFHDCTSLTSVTLPKNLDYIGPSAFSDCTSLKTITLPGTLTWIDGAAFANTGLTSVKIPGTVTNIAYKAFQNCTSLTSVSLPNGLESIEFSAFEGCSSLKNVTLPDSVMYLSYASFAGCSSLASVSLSDNLTSIGEAAFSDCVSLTGVTIPAGVTEIGGQAFYRCKSLTNVTVPDSVSSLGFGAFYNCDSLQTVKLSRNLDTLPSMLFEGCTSLERVRIPAGVRTILPNAFGNCGSVGKIVFEGSAPTIISSFRNTTANVYYPDDDSTWTPAVMQDYGGHLTWIPYSTDMMVSSVGDLTYILSGKSLQLQATQMEETVAAEWEITAGAQFASVSTGGMVTAKTVNEIQTIEVTATSVETGAVGTMELTILPGDIKLVITDSSWEGLIVDGKADLDISDCYKIRPLHATISGFQCELGSIQWTVKNAAISREYGDHNEYCDVEFGKLGTATVTATGPYGITGTATVNVYYATPDKKLTASVDAPAIGLQRGEMAKMVISGNLNPYALEFTVSDEEMASVSVEDDGDNLYIAVYGGNKPGTVKITAAIRNDPLKRSAVASVKIIPALTHSLTLDPAELTLDKADLTDAASRTFTITPEALDKDGNPVALNNKNIKWTSSDAKLAAVKVNADGSATVTIAAGKDGTAVITAQTTDAAKVTATMTLTVNDRNPKLANSKVTLNPMLADGTGLGLIAGFENPIETVTIAHADLDAVYDEAAGVWMLKANKNIKNSTIKTTVQVNGTYDLPLTVTVKSTIPAITIKQNTKLDLFYTDSQASLTVTAKDAVVTGLELTGTDDFRMDEAGVIRFADDLSEKYADNPKYKPNTKATLRVSLEGYAYAVEKAVTIGTSATKLTLSTDPASSTVNTNTKFGEISPRVTFALYNKAAKQVLDLEESDQIQVTGYDAKISAASDTISLTLNSAAKTTLTITVRKDNWMQAVTVKHNVAVTDKDPTVKLGKATLKLNTNLSGQTDVSSVTLSNSNLSLRFGEFKPVKPDANANLIQVSYNEESGCIEASFAGTQMPKAGTYSFTAEPVIHTAKLKAVTVKVNVVTAEPKVTLSAKGKLDTIDPESQITYTVSKIANAEGKLERITLKQGADLFELSELGEDAKGKQFVTLKLRENVTYYTKQTYKVSFLYQICGEEFETNPVNVKVSQSAPKIKASVGAYSQGQASVKLNVALTAPENAKMTSIMVNQDKTSRELLEALNIPEGNMLFFFLATGGLGSTEVSTDVVLNRPDSLIAGKSYKLALEICVLGQAGDVKATQVTVTVKVAK